MVKQHFGKTYGGNPAANYERFFVPAIGAPLTTDLIGLAALRPGERVLDVACGTGVVARLASQQVGDTGTVAGLDVNPGMLAVARSATPPGLPIEWHEASAEALRLTAPEAFLWQYVHSTPLAGAVAQVDDERRGSLARDVVAKWQAFVEDHALLLQVRVVVAMARK